MLPTGWNRYSPLSEAYSGFFQTDREIVAGRKGGRVETVAAPVAAGADDDADADANADADVDARPVPEPQSPSALRQKPLGGPTELLPYVSPAGGNVVTLTRLEFGVLCALAGAGIALLLGRYTRREIPATR